MLNINNFPNYFRAYSWNAKHSLYGYPEDAYPKFEWVAVLENRFDWIKTNCKSKNTASVYLLKEMIQWGGSQNGTLQKFEDGVGEINLQQILLNTISNLKNTEKAISAALDFPGMGLTYASKLLRFLDPERYGALDSRIRSALMEKASGVLPKIYDSSNKSMVSGYVAFTDYIEDIKHQLNVNAIQRPECRLPAGKGSSEWRAADIEMALFGWASSKE